MAIALYTASALEQSTTFFYGVKNLQILRLKTEILRSRDEFSIFGVKLRDFSDTSIHQLYKDTSEAFFPLLLTNVLSLEFKTLKMTICSFQNNPSFNFKFRQKIFMF